jgi:hypothetical protein
LLHSLSDHLNELFKTPLSLDDLKRECSGAENTLTYAEHLELQITLTTVCGEYVDWLIFRSHGHKDSELLTIIGQINVMGQCLLPRETRKKNYNGRTHAYTNTYNQGLEALNHSHRSIKEQAVGEWQSSEALKFFSKEMNESINRRITGLKNLHPLPTSIETMLDERKDESMDANEIELKEMKQSGSHQRHAAGESADVKKSSGSHNKPSSYPK